MSHDTPLGSAEEGIPQLIKERREFQEQFCARAGLPAPKPWTMEDEEKFQAKEAAAERRLEEWKARQERRVA
ncbi:hypothetical protein [Actinoplanes sp. L3-i22]|uniref:hypothetical protein n=1 Tax=Actinoplanes sp. L3-i22 TaxID=2836373 RepID=UPI001C753009|nr:hypothetical protein [Actinoplanes sp. L3-i22]BCY10286.1 hypothetical protein L3i22_053740 [Actinoplanes sp. L3-i22]